MRSLSSGRASRGLGGASSFVTRTAISGTNHDQTECRLLGGLLAERIDPEAEMLVCMNLRDLRRLLEGQVAMLTGRWQ